ncbi:hypothetical protein TNCV_2225931 [Trichonephila clavipes]|nr:hypothetical protein TNCV_2225931 [Trichonephila clavipes]
MGMTPELALPSPNFYATPVSGRLNLDKFKVQQSSLHGKSSVVQGSNSQASYESIILATRIPRPKTSV